MQAGLCTRGVIRGVLREVLLKMWAYLQGTYTWGMREILDDLAGATEVIIKLKPKDVER